MLDDVYERLKDNDMNSVSDVWKSVLDMLINSQRLTPTAYDTWFKDCQAVDLVDNKLVIHTPTAFKRDLIEQRFSKMLSDALMDIFSCQFEIVVLGGSEIDTYIRHNPDTDQGSSEGEYFTFDRFVVGPSNKFAHAAAMAEANEETKSFNPLFI